MKLRDYYLQKLKASLHAGDFRGLEVYINLGASLCGILAALFSVLSKVYASQSQESSSTAFSIDNLTPTQHQHVALMYFMISLVMCCATYVLYGVLRYNKYYRRIHREVVLKREVVKKTCKEEVLRLNPVFKGTWRLQITLFYLFSITICCFPTLQLGIVPQVS